MLANISIEVEEIINILKNNMGGLQIENIQCNENSIIADINLSTFISNVSIEIQFDRFENGAIYFEIVANDVINIIIKTLGLGKQGYGYSLNFPELKININELIESKISGLVINSVTLDNGTFLIKT